MVNPSADVLRLWTETGVVVRPGVSALVLDQWEERHGVRLGSELRAYFGTMDGMDEATMDLEAFTFWPLHKLVNLGREFADVPRGLAHPETYYVFAEWLIDSHHYAIQLSPAHGASGKVVCAMGHLHYEIASSFDEFLRAYLADPESVAHPPD
jgi:hypothetical protein